MRKVIRLHGGMRFYSLLLIGYLTISGITTDLLKPPLEAADYVLLGFCGLLGVWILFESLFTRMIATDTHLIRRNFLNGTVYSIAFQELTTYDFDLFGWVMSIGDKNFRTPRITNAELHTVIVKRAHQALLHAKVWKGGQIPPTEDFKNISTFDTRNWVSFFIFLLIGAAVLVLLRMQQTAATILTFLIIRNLYEMHTVFGDISLTTEGIFENYPWRKKMIHWEQILAVFRDRVNSEWVYTVVAEEATITVPSIVLQDGEHARKFFYNLPVGTRCINFPTRNSGGSGRRIRVRPETPVIGGILEPEMS